MAWRLILCMICSLTLFFVAGHSLADANSREYSVKAAYLYNFAKFVEWPGDSQTLDVCVLGKNPFGDALRVLEQEVAGKRKLQVFTNVTPKRLLGCHMVFISDSQQMRMQQWLAYLQGKPVLTVGEVENFVRFGGMIGFVKTHGRIKLAINPHAMNSAGLTIDPTLLEVAVEVVEE